MDAGQLIFLQVAAAGAVNGADGSTSALKGSVAVAQSATGIYTLTLGGGGIPAGECVCSITLRQAGTSNYIHTSATVKTVNTFAVDGTTATNKNFDFIVYALPAG